MTMRPEETSPGMDYYFDLLGRALVGDSRDFRNDILDKMLTDPRLKLRALPMICEVILRRRILGEREKEIRDFLISNLKVSEARAEDLMNLASLVGSEAADILDGVQNYYAGEDMLINFYEISAPLAKALLSMAVRVYLRSFFNPSDFNDSGIESNHYLMGSRQAKLKERIRLAFYVRENLKAKKNLPVIRAVLEEHRLLGGEDVDTFLHHVQTAYTASQKIADGEEGIQVFTELGIQDMPVDVMIYTLKFLEQP